MAIQHGMVAWASAYP